MNSDPRPSRSGPANSIPSNRVCESRRAAARVGLSALSTTSLIAAALIIGCPPGTGPLSNIPGSLPGTNAGGAPGPSANTGDTDPAADPDNDGIPNQQEIENGTDPNTANAEVRAFPTAEGFGAFAFGGRGDPAAAALGGAGTRVLKVTTLADTVFDPVTNTHIAAPGSLREAVEASHPRFVVFNVNGVIHLTRPLAITHPYITIAGQTAPGNGITLAHYGLDVKTHDVVIRYVRLRQLFDDAVDFGQGGFIDGMTLFRNDDEVQNVQTDAVHHVILDHCSLSWTVDSGINVYSWVRDFTMQWCIIAESSRYGQDILPEGRGWLSDVTGTADPGNLSQITIHHSLFAQNSFRNPAISSGRILDFRNNVVYNWRVSQPAQFRHASLFNFVGNYYVDGLDVSIAPPARYVIDVIDPATSSNLPRLFIQGNLGPLRTSLTQTEWDIGVAYPHLNVDGACPQPPNTFCLIFPAQVGQMSLFELTSPAAAPAVTTQDVISAKNLVLQNAGCTVPMRDIVDARVVAETEYVINTRPFQNPDPNYDPNADPQLRHVGPSHGPLTRILIFKPQNDPGGSCIPRLYRIRQGQSELDAKLELLSRLNCTFPDGLTLPANAAQIIADPVTYQWETVQVHVPDRATVDALYPSNLAPTLPPDADGDAIPDAFEAQIGTNPAVADSVQDADGDGYLNIEEYINSLAG